MAVSAPRVIALSSTMHEPTSSWRVLRSIARVCRPMTARSTALGTPARRASLRV
jgi:hypothetical protein